MRIVIDSNIWINVFINNDSQSFIKKILDREIEIISSSRQVEEVSNVLSRPKIKNVIAHELIEEFLILFFKSVDIVETKIKIKVCRDEKDNFILETAISGSVDYIVTEDKDLLVLNPYETVKIVTAKEFYKII